MEHFFIETIKNNKKLILSFIIFILTFLVLGASYTNFDFSFAILLHAINAVILFNLFFPFTSILFAFWGALFFAFHVSLSSWFGWFDSLANIFNFLLILLTIIFLKKYLENRRSINYIFALITFLISLFIKETAIIMPLWLMYAAYLYENYLKINTKSFLQSIIRYIKFTLSFWFCAIFYFFIKHILCLLKFSDPSLLGLSTTKFFLNLRYKFGDLIKFLTDIFGLSFLSPKHQILKISLIILFFTCFLWSFSKNTKKKYILFFVFSMILFSWAAILQRYSSMEFYKVLPFCALTVIFLVNFYKAKTEKDKLNYIKYSLIFFYSFLFMSIFSVFFAIKKQKYCLNNLNNNIKSNTSKNLI